MVNGQAVRAFIDKAAGNVGLSEDEYIDHSDGLIHCKKCGGKRQTILPDPLRHSYLMPRCVCPCQQEAEKQREAAGEQRALMESIRRRRVQGLQDRYLHDFTFANALIDQDIPVLMTNIPSILNRLAGMFAEDRVAFISALDDYSLLILDDLGVERNTGYALEQMFPAIQNCFYSMLRNSAGVIIVGFSKPDSRKSLSPVSRTSAFAAIAALKMGRSSASLTCDSVCWDGY